MIIRIWPMKITRTFGEYFKYSLHDARVQKIEYADDNLIFTFEYIFSYDNSGEQTHKAKIVFEKCDVDDFEILVFDSTILDTFTGKKLSYLSINRSIVKVSLRSLQRPIIGAALYCKGGYGLKGSQFTV